MKDLPNLEFVDRSEFAGTVYRWDIIEKRSAGKFGRNAQTPGFNRYKSSVIRIINVR